MVFGKKEEEPKQIMADMTEGGNEFVCMHKSHNGERFVIVGDHQKYQLHLAEHGKKVLGTSPCMRCAKPANQDLRPTKIGVKPMCEECIVEMAEIFKQEGLVK